MRHAAALITAALMLAALPHLTTQSQQEAEQPALREVTLQLAGVSRGYARPLSRTAERVRQLPGIQGAEAVSAGGDCIVLRVSTSMDNEALAAALGGVLLGGSSTLAVIAPVDNMRSRRAVARYTIMKVAAAIMEQPKPHWRDNDSAVLFTSRDSLDAKLRKLGLTIDLTGLPNYSPTDFRIEESWQGSGGTYRVWAGDKWGGLPVFDQGRWWTDDDSNSPATLEPDPESNFVGAEISRSSWSSGLFWADLEGAILESPLGARAETTWDDSLVIHAGKKWMEDILSAVVALRVREPERQIDAMPKGRGWNILSNLVNDDEDDDLQRWGTQGYNQQALQLDWSEDDERQLSLRFRAHHPGHALYLDAQLDVDAAVKRYKSRDDAQDSPRRVDVSGDIRWLVNAEESVEVFKQRRQAVLDSMARLQTAVTEAAREHSLDVLCGSLSDEQLRGRLGFAPSGEHDLEAGQYVIRRQLFGDVEITAGEPKNGGTRWILLNPESGTVFRRYQ